MFEHQDVRVRAGPLGARSVGQSNRHDVGETVIFARSGLGYFRRTESNPRAVARGTASLRYNSTVC